jgi:hypothetical protein
LEATTGVGAAARSEIGGKMGDAVAGSSLWQTWRANTASKSVKSFSCNEAVEELTSRSSVGGGRQSDDYEHNE